MFNSTLYPIQVSPFQIRYVDLSRDAVPVRPAQAGGARTTSRTRAAIGVVVAAVLAIAIYGFANAQSPSAGDPVRGEFRLGPGLQQPPGYVIPL